MCVMLFVFVCTYLDYKYEWGDAKDEEEKQTWNIATTEKRKASVQALQKKVQTKTMIARALIFVFI